MTTHKYSMNMKKNKPLSKPIIIYIYSRNEEVINNAHHRQQQQQ